MASDMTDGHWFNNTMTLHDIDTMLSMVDHGGKRKIRHMPAIFDVWRCGATILHKLPYWFSKNQPPKSAMAVI